MDNILNELKNKICTFSKKQDISVNEIIEFKNSCVVVLAVGGKGQRIKSLTGDSNKNVLKILKTNETLVERVIKMYAKAGIKKFVALVYEYADSIKDVLGNGQKFGVNIIYSYDPQKPVGRGGAILNALLNGSINKKYNLIVHNPDDQIIEDNNFVDEIIYWHLVGQQQGNDATAIVVCSTPYQYTGMKIINGQVKNIEMYPQIPIPAHIGVTVFNKNIYSDFEKLFNLQEKVDFEKVLFPYLTKQKRLFAFGIQNDNWIAVNDPKSYEELNKRLELI